MCLCSNVIVSQYWFGEDGWCSVAKLEHRTAYFIVYQLSPLNIDETETALQPETKHGEEEESQAAMNSVKYSWIYLYLVMADGFISML